LVRKNSSFNEFVEKPLVKAILKALVMEELTIPQLRRKIDINDNRLLIAYLTELQYLGLVIPIKKENNQDSKEPNHLEYFQGLDLLINSQTKWDSPLGISIAEYNTIWQKITKENKNDDLEPLKTIAFTIPAPFKQKFKENMEVEEK
jgi:hypothetical protein